jgi:hypothetical protein
MIKRIINTAQVNTTTGSMTLSKDHQHSSGKYNRSKDIINRIINTAQVNTTIRSRTSSKGSSTQLR